MSERQQLVAYLATLATLIIVFVAALVAACIRPDLVGRLEAFGLGTITGGLIGVLRLPTSARTAVGPVTVNPDPGNAIAAPDPQQ